MQFEQNKCRQLLGCGHRVCVSCLKDTALKAAVNADGCGPHPPCPVAGCNNVPDSEKGTIGWLGPAAAKELLTPADYDSWLHVCLETFKEQEKAADTLVRCPQCMLCFTRISPTVSMQEAEASAENLVTEPAPELADDEADTEEPMSEPVALVFDALGNKRSLTIAEQAHFDEHRFRCPECSSIFCRLCEAVPYHSEYRSDAPPVYTSSVVSLI